MLIEIFEKMRIWLAASISPVAVSVCVYITMLLIMAGGKREQDDAVISNIGTASWVVYFISLLLGVGAYYLLRHKGWYGVREHLFAGMVCGFLTWLIFSLFSMKIVFVLFFVYIIGGTLMGAMFWLIAYFQPDGNYQFKTRRRRRRTI